MANLRKFKIATIDGKYQVLQYGGMGITQKRGKPFDTQEEAKADITKRIEAMGATQTKNRPWAHPIPIA